MRLWHPRCIAVAPNISGESPADVDRGAEGGVEVGDSRAGEPQQTTISSRSTAHNPNPFSSKSRKNRSRAPWSSSSGLMISSFPRAAIFTHSPTT